MNQTKKRLKIINLAISITDIETIQLQILKLIPLKTDEKIQEIITELQAENYAQTQALIHTYIETPTEEIIQRSSQVVRQLKKSEEEDIIEEFDLFVTTEKKQDKEEKEIFDFGTLEPDHSPKREHETIDFDTLLNIEADDILSGNIKMDINSADKDTFFNNREKPSKSKKESHIDTGIIPKDTFFDIGETVQIQDIPTEKITMSQIKQKEKIPDEENFQENHIDTETIPKDTFFDTEEADSIQEPGNEEIIEKEFVSSSTQRDETIFQKDPETILSENETSTQYNAITYIDQKLKNMQTQYPPIDVSDENFSSVNAWLLQISHNGYSEDEVEEIIKYITKLTETNSLAEAAQLLLISGATQSKFAQFMLARELYKGKILEKNLPESFTLINRLAMDDNYPEAICDLAQFYEHGIGISKDKKRAQMLYKEAMDLNITRAIGHYERLRKENSGLFSAFKK